FFQAEDGIRDFHVTGVQTCALPISQLDLHLRNLADHYRQGFHLLAEDAEIAELNGRYKPVAEAIQAHLEETGSLAGRPDLVAALADVNTASDRKSTRLNSSHVKISYAVF